MRHKIIDTRRRALVGATLSSAVLGVVPRLARAADPIRIGVILPMSGPFESTGRQVEAAIRLYVARNGDTVAGWKIELIVRNDTGLAPETTKRYVQELVVKDQVAVLAGFGLTPLTLAATSIGPQKSPYIVRTGFTLSQVTQPLADRAAKNGIRRVVTLVADYGPGLDAEKTFVKHFTEAGGAIVESIRSPLRNPVYAPFLQRARDAKPDALFVFVPSGEGTGVLKQFVDRGLKDAGIKLICTGDVLGDDLLESIGPAALGVISSHHCSCRARLTEEQGVRRGLRGS